MKAGTPACGRITQSGRVGWTDEEIIHTRKGIERSYTLMRQKTS